VRLLVGRFFGQKTLQHLDTTFEFPALLVQAGEFDLRRERGPA
jgi:hypothetical protein